MYEFVNGQLNKLFDCFFFFFTADRFQEATVVLTNSECPSWAKESAEKWGIPLLAPAWIKQCLIDGKIVDHETQYVYRHDYKKIKTSK